MVTTFSALLSYELCVGCDKREERSRVLEELVMEPDSVHVSLSLLLCVCVCACVCVMDGVYFSCCCLYEWLFAASM